MEITADIHQLKSSRKMAFINVYDQNDGRVGIWGIKPCTVLALDGIRFELYTFDDDEYMAEWWAENVDRYDKLINLNTIEI